jgi:hypothetical protein
VGYFHLSSGILHLIEKRKSHVSKKIYYYKILLLKAEYPFWKEQDEFNHHGVFTPAGCHSHSTTQHQWFSTDCFIPWKPDQ